MDIDIQFYYNLLTNIFLRFKVSRYDFIYTMIKNTTFSQKFKILVIGVTLLYVYYIGLLILFSLTKFMHSRLCYFYPDFNLFDLLNTFINDRLECYMFLLNQEYMTFNLDLVHNVQNDYFKNIDLKTLSISFRDRPDMSDRIVITRKRPGPNDSSVREVLDNYGLRKMYNFGTRNFEC